VDQKHQLKLPNSLIPNRSWSIAPQTKRQCSRWV